MRNLFVLLLACTTLLVSIPHRAIAQEEPFAYAYRVEYFIKESGTVVTTDVTMAIGIRNKTKDTYIDKVTLAFPRSFTLRNLNVTDDNGPVQAQVQTDSRKLYLTLPFNDPAIGAEMVNRFNVQFTQENLLSVNGNIWEMMIPTVDNREGIDYTVIVHLPPAHEKKLSIAKPKPDSVEGNIITWNSPKAKTIYAAFGDKQYYELSLTYSIMNSKDERVKTEIAVPPDTLYQKMIFTQLNPPPVSAYRDADGNLMFQYVLEPQQKKQVQVSAVADIRVQAREEVIPTVRRAFEEHKNALLDADDVWKLPSNASFAAEVRNPESVYRTVLQTLTYNFDRLLTENRRLGAREVLSRPQDAVCVEYSDLFIAIAREKGIYSREIQGFGYSTVEELRPQSLNADVLHSWPEYYDETAHIWIPVDPTWEDTSGIDYFSSLDFNHITFAIHGKDPHYPYPAGMYKSSQSRDVFVKPITEKPEEKKSLAVRVENLPERTLAGSKYEMEFIVKNTGNTYVWDVPLTIRTTGTKPDEVVRTIELLAPHEEKKIPVSFTMTNAVTPYTASISAVLAGNTVFSTGLSVLPDYYPLAFTVAAVVGGISVLLLLLRLGWRWVRK